MPLEIDEFDYLEDDDEIQAPDIGKDAGGGPAEASGLDSVINELKALNEKLSAQQPDVAKAEDLTPPPPPMPDEIGYDPKEIATVSGNIAVSAVMSLSRAERELRREFPELDDEAVEEVVNRLSSMSPVDIANIVRNNGHLAMGYAQLGAAYKGGKVKSKAKDEPPMVTPTGLNNSESQAVSEAEAEFEKLYGKPKSKAQRERLRNLGRVF